MCGRPLEIDSADPEARHRVPFIIADDLASAGRVRSVSLQLTVDNLCSEDTLQIFLNGESLEEEPMERTHGMHHARMLGADHTSSRPPHSGGPGLAMTLHIDLCKVRPKPGGNTLEFCLAARPVGLGGGVRVHKVELAVNMGALYPSGHTARL